MLAENKQWKVHFELNSKGGVGKSFVASLLGQHHQYRGEPFLCFDADATTATLSRFKKLNVRRIELMEGTILNPRQFDTMLEAILTEDAHCIVDTGASSFVAVSHYIIENDVHEQIRLAGKSVVVHIIVVGGATLPETLNDLDALASQLPASVDIIVWLNEHFGVIRGEDGKSFSEMQAYNVHKARIGGLVHLPQRTAATFGEDIKQMMALNLTFEEAIASPAFNLMAKQRLRLVNEDLRRKLSTVL